jgi:ABC-2 type transport system ATP-binding protein
MTQPELVILDEPFSGLDPVNAEIIRAIMLEQRRNGVTIIFSTHDMNAAESLCDFVFMIFQGRKVLDGTLAEIQGSYRADTLRVRVEGGPDVYEGLPGADRCPDVGRFQELRLRDGADAQVVLKALTERGRVHHFELARPSLHEIFVRIAKPPEETDSGSGGAR